MRSGRIEDRTHVAVALLCCAAIFIAASCSGTSGSHKTGRLGTDPVAVSFASGGADVLRQWVLNGYRGVTLIHFGTDDGLSPIRDEAAGGRELRLKSSKADPAPLQKEGGPGRSNYISAAVRMGIVGEIYWVIPYEFFGSAGGGEKARQLLLERGLVKDQDEAARFRMAGGCLAGALRNTEITICSPDTLHMIDKPVLVTMDMTFFPAYAKARGTNLLESFKVLLDAVFSRRYKVLAAYTLPYAVDESFDPAFSFLGSELREALINPAMVRQETPPKLWLARDKGDALIRGGNFQRAYIELKASVREFGDDRGLRSLLACAAVMTGMREEALSIAGDLCRDNRSQCGLLLHLGSIADDAGYHEEASVFFRKALDAVPGWKAAEEKLSGMRSTKIRQDRHSRVD